MIRLKEFVFQQSKNQSECFNTQASTLAPYPTRQRAESSLCGLCSPSCTFSLGTLSFGSDRNQVHRQDPFAHCLLSLLSLVFGASPQTGGEDTFSTTDNRERFRRELCGAPRNAALNMWSGWIFLPTQQSPAKAKGGKKKLKVTLEKKLPPSLVEQSCICPQDERGN